MTRRFSDCSVQCSACDRPIRARSPVHTINGEDFHVLCAQMHTEDMATLGRLAEAANKDTAWRTFTRLEEAL